MGAGGAGLFGEQIGSRSFAEAVVHECAHMPDTKLQQISVTP